MKLKIAVGLALGIFFALVIAVLAAALVLREIKPASSTKQTLTTTTQATTEVLTAAKVATHQTAADCWIIIENKVYAVTPYLESHPGGSAAIIPYCGKEATNAFATKGGTGQGHSAMAKQILNEYFIGQLGEAQNQVVKADLPTPTPTKTAPVTNSSILTTLEIAKHNTTADCWLIISGKVYNVTTYLAQHPGGIKIVAPYCGKEATTAFATQGGGGSHSGGAYAQINSYLLGPVNGTTTITPLSTTAAPPPNMNLQTKYPNATIVEQNREDNGTQELKLRANGECREIKLDAAGQIITDKPC